MTMIKGEVNELSKEDFNNFHLALKKQLADQPSDEFSRNKRQWNVKASQFAVNTTNPIRAIVEHLNVQPNPDKAFIPLSVGKLLFKFFFFFFFFFNVRRWCSHIFYEYSLKIVLHTNSEFEIEFKIQNIISLYFVKFMLKMFHFEFFFKI